MSTAPPPRSGPRIGTILLILAWLSLLGVVGAAVGYVAVKSNEAKRDAERAASVALKQAAPEPAPVAAPEPETRAKPEPVAPAEPESTPAKPAEPAQAPAADEVPAAAPPEAAPTDTQQAALPRLPLPKILPPWRRNAQPFDARDPRPRIAIVFTGLGLSSAATEAAIKTLPGAISLAFTPYSRRLNEWVALARVNGHEVLLDLPMEPTSYPNDDPGPQALLTALSGPQNVQRLDWALKRVTGYVGVVAIMGSRFAASRIHLTPIMEEIKARGLLYLDNRATQKGVAGALAAELSVPYAVNDRFLDLAQASRVAVDDRLRQLERVARDTGAAVAIGQLYPVTIERVREWARDVERRGFVLAPISALAANSLAASDEARTE